MPVVRVILREGQDKVYHRSHVTDHPESRQYRRIAIRVFPGTWEYVEDISEGTGEDTQTDTSVSG